MDATNLTVAVDIGENSQKILEQLGAQLGLAAEHVWPVLIQQQVYEGIYWISACLFILITSVIGFFAVMKKAEWDQGPDNWQACLQIITIVIFVLAGCFLIFGGMSALGQIFNSEYYAMMKARRLLW